MAGVIPSAEAWKRVAAVVRRVENTPTSRAGETSATYGTGAEFYAMILGSDLSGRYSFNRVSPDPERLRPNAFIIGDDPIPWSFEGDAHLDAAREAGNNLNVPTLAIVRMTYVGTDPDGKPSFIFFHHAAEAQQPGLAPHDHRDNRHGGFSFACFHPGTSLPQMPWAM